MLRDAFPPPPSPHGSGLNSQCIVLLAELFCSWSEASNRSSSARCPRDCRGFLPLVASGAQRLMLFRSLETNKPHARVTSGIRPASRVPTTPDTPLSRKAFSSALMETELFGRFALYLYTKSDGALLSPKRNLAIS